METTQILIIISSVFLSIAWYGIRKMCPNCHRWNGLKRISSDHERTDTRYRTETVTTTKKDKYGKITGSFEKQESVPYNVSFYKVTFKCKSCNQQVQRTMRNGRYLQEAAVVLILSLFLLFFAFKPNIDNTEPVNTNSVKNSNNTVETFDKKSQEKDLNTKDVQTKAKITVNTKPETTSKTIENVQKNESQKNELEKGNINENQKSAQVIQKQIITQETPEYIKKGLAITMLSQGKNIDEIADSTFLAKKEIRKLKRNLQKSK